MSSGNTLTSQFSLCNTLAPYNNSCVNFGQNVSWLTPTTFQVTGTANAPDISPSTFFDGTVFDGATTIFGDFIPSGHQKIEIYQLLEAKNTWINSNASMIQSVPVNFINVLPGTSSTDITLAGGAESIFLVDSNNPDQSISIYNNESLSPGYVVTTSQEPKLDPQSISKAWIYDSVEKTKLVDLEVVDVYHGLFPNSISQNLDFISDIDPATYGILPWMPHTSYNIGDIVEYGPKVYQSLINGKSGSIFNSSLWKEIPIEAFYANGPILWGSSQVGKFWMDTRDLKALDAQIGASYTERSQNWNTWFPTSQINIYEWVQSPVVPSQYVQNDSNGYILGSDYPYAYDSASKMYVFWVKNKNSVGPIHQSTGVQVAQSIENIASSGIPIISPLASNAVAVWNVDSYISNHSAILHIDYVMKSSNNNLHNEFALISNDGSKSWYNTPIYSKFIDSISGRTNSGSLVPDYTLSPSQQTGILNNPIQSLFVNRPDAISIYFGAINEALANINIATSNVIATLSQSDPIPTSGYDKIVSTREVLNSLIIGNYPEGYRILVQSDDSLIGSMWSIVQKSNGNWIYAQTQLYNLTDYWEFADWYSSNYETYTSNSNNTFIINNLGEIPSVTYGVNDIITVGNSATYIVDANLSLEPIYVQDGTIQFLPNLYDFAGSGIGFSASSFDSQYFDNDPYLPLRYITQALNEIILAGNSQYNSDADKAFFSILNYIFYENSNLDWLLKTSFVKANYQNRNLNIQGSYIADNSNVVRNFLSETLPYHTRLREFNDIQSAYDFGNIGTSDFDIPSQYDVNYRDLLLSYTANPKFNTSLPAIAFDQDLGISVNNIACYVNSNGFYGIPTAPSWGNVKYEIATPEALDIHGNPIFNSAGNVVDVHLSSNVAISASYTINDGLPSNLPVDTGNANVHSPILGYAWDGFPIYGSWGYDANGNIVEQVSSYRLSNVPRLNVEASYVNAYEYPGMVVTDTYSDPDGYITQDYQYVQGYGTLDECNGKFGVTPEYPNGIYAYFLTKTYPYVIGDFYFGRPLGLKYSYINGINTPVYANQGNLSVTTSNTFSKTSLIRSPDGSIDSDTTTLSSLPIYAGWSNNHTYEIESIEVSHSGVGYQNLESDVIFIPDGKASANVSGLKLASATIVDGGQNYALGDTLTIVGGDCSNSAMLQVTSLGVNNSVSSVNVIDVPTQEYTSIPVNYSNAATITSTSNGYGATFALEFGIESIAVIDGGNFTQTPQIVIIDEFATSMANAYPFLENDTIRKINIGLRFDRVSNTVEALDVNTIYPLGSVVYGNNSFLISIIDNAPGSQYANANVWTNADLNSIYESTSQNRLTIYNNPTSNATMGIAAFSNIVNVSGGNLAISYVAPNGSIFDADDGNLSQSLNISWRPELVLNSALSSKNPRFGNACAVLGTSQYFQLDASSTQISTLEIGNNPFTLEFFVYPNDNNSNGVIVDMRDSIDSRNGLMISLVNGFISYGNVTVTNPLITNSWNYIVLNGGNGSVYSYVNGQLSGQSSGGFDFTDANLTIGADCTGSNVFYGNLDEIRLTRNYHRYPLGEVGVTVPDVPFPNTLAEDPYLSTLYTPLLWECENLSNDGPSNLKFKPVNYVSYIQDLSWNEKSTLELVGYDSTLFIDGLSLENSTSILGVSVNE